MQKKLERKTLVQALFEKKKNIYEMKTKKK